MQNLHRPTEIQTVSMVAHTAEIKHMHLNVDTMHADQTLP